MTTTAIERKCDVCDDNEEHVCPISFVTSACPGPVCPFCLECHADTHPGPCGKPFEEGLEEVTEDEIKNYNERLNIYLTRKAKAKAEAESK